MLIYYFYLLSLSPYLSPLSLKIITYPLNLGNIKTNSLIFKHEWSQLMV